MTLVLVRHGETALNASRVLQPADTPLSPRGLAQAQAVAERLAGAGLAAVLSSDMPRALQTAQAIVAAGGLPLHTSPLLHERNFGDLRGLPYDSLDHDPIESPAAPPGGESLEVFHQRIDRAFAQALALRATLGGPLAVVSHGLVIRAWLDRLVRLPPGHGPAPRIGNTAVSVLAAQPPYEALLVNCTTHLSGRVAEDGSSLSGG
ncbi:MAG: histidine phosphatase family protein [Rubrivivax sp.]